MPRLTGLLRTLLEYLGGYHGRWLLFGLATLVILSREPHLLREPRFWAEEGSIHFAYAFQHSPLRSLLLVPTTDSPAGYLHLPANLAAVVAVHAVDLEQAPLVTTLAALLAQLLPTLVVVFGSSLLWSSPVRRLLCVLLLLFAPIAHSEVWLNTTNSQVFCGITGLLLLAEDLENASQRRLWVYRLLLLFCALSGIYTILLTPAYFVRERLLRTRETRLHFAILGLGLILQSGFVAWTKFAGGIEPERFGGMRIAQRMAGALISFLLYPVLGQGSGDTVARQLGLASVARGEHVAMGHAMLIVGISILLFGALGFGLLRMRRPAERPLVVAFLALVVAVPVLAYRGSIAERYGFVPGSALLLVLLLSAFADPLRWRHRAALGLVTVSLAIGVATFWREIPVAFEGDSSDRAGTQPGGPVWRSEVAAWRRDPQRPLRIWPLTSGVPWELYLQSGYDFAAQQRQLARVLPVDVVSRHGEVVEKTLPLLGLPPEFKLVLEVLASQPCERLMFEVVLRDATGSHLAAQRVNGCLQDRAARLLVDSRYFRRDSGAQFARTRALALRLSSPLTQPTRIHLSRAFLSPRVEGVLDSAWAGAFAETTTRRPRVPRQD